MDGEKIMPKILFVAIFLLANFSFCVFPLPTIAKEISVTGQVEIGTEAGMTWYYIKDYLIGADGLLPEDVAEVLFEASNEGVQIKATGTLDDCEGCEKSFDTEKEIKVVAVTQKKKLTKEEKIRIAAKGLQITKPCVKNKKKAIPFTQSAVSELSEYLDLESLQADFFNCYGSSDIRNPEPDIDIECKINAACTIAQNFEDAGYSFSKSIESAYSNIGNYMLANRVGLQNVFAYAFLLGSDQEVRRLYIDAGIMTEKAYTSIERLENQR